MDVKDIYFLLIAFMPSGFSYLLGKYSLLMPNVRPNKPELYLCTPIRVDYHKDYYITGFEPNASMATAHHMLLYGCKAPGSSKEVWPCGEMTSSEEDRYEPPCSEGSQILYAWARDAPPFRLPDGVGFKVGGKNPIQYLVLQVHYAHIDKFKDGSTDDSGIFLQFTERPQSRQAGVLLLGTGGSIQPHTREHMETSCEMKEDKIIYPIAFRPHTHSLGKVVSGYKVERLDNGTDKWTLLGRRDPMLPQMFTPVFDTSPIRKGDLIAVRCTMESDRDRVTVIGSTQKDEMCNFYLMYYVDMDDPLETKYCFSSGPPYYYWDVEGSFNHIPVDD